MSKKIPVYAWYFPNWHPDARNEAFHGKGWTEWELLKHAAQRFEGHQIYHPLWGYENEANPLVMEKKIDAALKYGVDGFLWDFYWYDDEVGEGDTKGSYRLKALNEGFFGAKNNEQFQIALMWCNHDAVNSHPASYLKTVSKNTNLGASLISGMMSPQGFQRMTQYMIDNYFCRKNYMRVDGKLYFVIWSIRMFLNSMGSVEGARTALDHLRQRVRDAGLGEMFIATETCQTPGINDRNAEENAEYYRAIGIDGGVNYCWGRCARATDQWPAMEYADFMTDGIQLQKNRTKQVNLPYSIGVCQGWDVSLRTLPSDMYDPIGYPFDWIVRHKDPAEFERALRALKEFYLSDESTSQFISLITWNEWTEGNYMEPSVEQGYAYLEAVKRVFVDEE